MESFLMIGQSNMAGRGFLKDVPRIFDAQIKMQRNGLWQTMWEPINPDRPFSGIGLSASFAALWRRANPEQEIGLIPCAEGGSSLEDWKVGGPLFEHAVFQAKLAQQSSKITGILWHQGENDCFGDLAAIYKDRFGEIIDALRNALSLPKVPLIIGGLGDFLPSGRYGAFFGAYPLVNKALLEYATQASDCYFVSAEDLTANPDGLHFDANSLRRFGVRYFEAFDQHTHVLKALEDETEKLEAIYRRPLTKKEQSTLLEYRFAFGDMTLQELEAEQVKLK